jgi:formylglycine-generating enzyme required for sulfatase activity
MTVASESERTISEPGRIFYDTLKDASNGPEMVIILPKTFRMGDVKGDGLDNELPVHSVHIQKAFAIGRYPITLEEYKKFARKRGRQSPDDHQRPVVNMSWHDAVEFAKWLSVETGKLYRLPSEAEWEYAARSGGKQEIWAGTSREQELEDYAWYEGNSGRRTHTVGGKKPNRLGLCDMSGNVWEWVEDCWHQNYEGAPTDGSAWLEANRGDCGRRVLRGGSWGDGPEFLRASGRYWDDAVIRNGYIGFRLARDLDPMEVETKLSESQSVTELASLEGHWVDTESGTHAYAKLINGELVAPYCYGGNHNLTGVYYGLRNTGEYWFGRFKWLGGGSGFSFLKRESVDLLNGAWWSAEGNNVPDAPPKESGFQSTWKREKDWEPPSWARQFFEEVGREGLASRVNRD